MTMQAVRARRRGVQVRPNPLAILIGLAFYAAVIGACFAAWGGLVLVKKALGL